MHSFLVALAFLTVLPLRFRTLPAPRPWLLGAAVVAARCLALTRAGLARYPRREGTGKVLVEATGGGEAIVFAVAGGAAALAVVPGAEPLPALALYAPALLAVL